MNHEESKLQQQCVAWFRAQFPHYSMLLMHPINEGSGHTTTDRRRQGIHKAEGAVAGVPDLILFMPAEYLIESGFGPTYMGTVNFYHSLGIEFKTPKGSQSQQQKDFQKMYEASDNMYVIVRSFEQFVENVTAYMKHVRDYIRHDADLAYRQIARDAEKRERDKLQRIIKKK